MSARDMNQQTVQAMAHALLDSLPEEYAAEEAMAALLTLYVSIATGLPEFKRVQFGKLLAVTGEEMKSAEPFVRVTH
ncbi:MAG: hypothetical protein B7Y42_00375 [Polaromonas sp. 28-63-22]|jgi:hypothetical protein|nr:MAG: hypothetical protein B7Y42_00375 [Polaromonas sp. 28-63-22]